MKDYDSTLARMAGNIAAGIVDRRVDSYGSTYCNLDEKNCAHIAATAVTIAKHIVTLCKADYAVLPAANLQQ